MLPDFPRTKDQIRQRITLGIFHAVRAKAPLLAEIKTLVQHEGKVHAYDRIRAAPVTEGYEKLAVPVTITFSEVPALVGEKLAAKIDGIAEEMARLEMDMFYRKHSQASEEAGNAFDSHGAPLTGDMILDLLENVDMHFGPDNRLLQKFVVGPEHAEHLQRLFEEPAFRARYEDLLERKRSVWRDRESNRKLAD